VRYLHGSVLQRAHPINDGACPSRVPYFLGSAVAAAVAVGAAVGAAVAAAVAVGATVGAAVSATMGAAVADTADAEAAVGSGVVGVQANRARAETRRMSFFMPPVLP